MHFGLLRTFIVVVELRSVTGAARVLHLAQSVVSTQMATLARLSGLTLVERRGGTLALTQQGYEFYIATRAVMHSVTLLRDVAIKARSDATLVLRAAGPRGACDILMGSVVAPFLRAHPQVQFTSQTIKQRDIPSLLSTGDVDFLFVDQESKRGFHTFHPLVTDRLCLALNRDDPFAEKSTIEASDLPGLKFAIPPLGSKIRSLIDDQLGSLAARLNVIAEIDSASAIIQCVKSGLCASLISETILANANVMESIVTRDVEGLDLSRTFGILTDPQRTASPALQCFLRWLASKQPVGSSL